MPQIERRWVMRSPRGEIIEAILCVLGVAFVEAILWFVLGSPFR